MGKHKGFKHQADQDLRLSSFYEPRRDAGKRATGENHLGRVANPEQSPLKGDSNASALVPARKCSNGVQSPRFFRNTR